LREAGISKSIVLMEGLYHDDELAPAAQHDFTLIVHHPVQVDMLEKAGDKHTFPVWLKLNTGMHRLGVHLNEFEPLYQRLQAAASVKKPIALMTHFAEADDPESEATSRQIQLFEQITRHLQAPRSLANSAGILAWPQAHADWVRPGLMLYGASPFANKTGLDHGLKPVMSLSSQLIAIQHVSKGGKVGYGGTWAAEKDTLVGIVGAGYGDGYPQFAQNGTPVLVNKLSCRLAGRVSMDMLAVDLSACPEAKLGDEVILWGQGLPVETVAADSQTSAYEILTRMTSRPRRR